MLGKDLKSILHIAQSYGTKKIAVASAEDEDVLKAVKEAVRLTIADPILVGNKKEISLISNKIGLDISKYEIIDEPVPEMAAIKAIELIRNQKAEILMKGMISTGGLLKAVIDKSSGLKTEGVLSHVAFFESPYYHKLLCVTDAAMNIAPDLKGKISILQNAVSAYHKLGVKVPKVAIIGAVENVNLSMQATTDAAILTMMNKRGQIKGCLVDGPLALDNAISKEAADHKGIISDISGDVDILLTPDINSGNILYKSLNFLGGAVSAALILGATVPIVLTSRADSDQSKLMSIALAAAMQ